MKFLCSLPRHLLKSKNLLKKLRYQYIDSDLLKESDYVKKENICNTKEDVKIVVKREFLGIHKLSTLYESIVEKNIDERLKKSPESSQFTVIRNCI